MESEEHKMTEIRNSLEERIIFEYDFSLPTPLKVFAVLLCLAMIIIPIVLELKKDTGKGGIPDTLFMVFVFIPIVYNVVAYKKHYYFTEKGIHLLNKAKSKSGNPPTPRLIMEWQDHNHYKKAFLGYILFSRKALEQKFKSSYTDTQEDKTDFEELYKTIKPTYVFCNREQASQIEYIFMSRSLLPYSGS
ncbi:MAG: hypothetical protein JW737_02150 [Acidobacteria bacterium]|nr:hypothetical protein [Acidobacteriota bacterium]